MSISDIKHVRVRGVALPGKQSGNKFLMENGEPPYDNIMEWVTENIDDTHSIRYESLDHTGVSIGSTTINSNKKRGEKMSENNTISNETVSKAASIGGNAMETIGFLKMAETVVSANRTLAEAMQDQGKVISSLAESLRKNTNGENVTAVGGLLSELNEEKRRRHRVETELAILKNTNEGKKEGKTIDSIVNAMKEINNIMTPEKMLETFIDKLKTKGELPKFIKALEKRDIKDLVEITAYVSLMCAEAVSKKDPAYDFLTEVGAKIGELATSAERE